MPKTSSDKRWARFNQKLQTLMKSNDFFGLGTTYYEMADFLDKEGKDSAHLRKLGYEMKLRFSVGEIERFKESNVVTGVDILCFDDACEDCKKLKNKTFSLDKALSIKPIPVKSCTHKYGCRCSYVLKLD